MKLHFIKANPSGNTTVLILDSVSPASYAAVADAVMSHTGVGAEQVGFVVADPGQPAGCRLEMAGGEFCGNGSRSFAAWLYLFRGVAPRDPGAGEAQLPVRVSGCAGSLTARIRDLGQENRCRVSIAMPEPDELRTGVDSRLGPYSLVAFPGISHLVLWAHAPEDGDAQLGSAFFARLGPPPPAFGLMYYDEASRFLRPLVHVEAGDTLIWENSCGSGSAAVAAALAAREARSVRDLTLRQPGGELTVDADWRDGVGQLRLGGVVEFTAAGELYL